MYLPRLRMLGTTLCLLALLPAMASAQELVCDVFVRKGATGDGSSWEKAFPELHEALAARVEPGNICVAAGAYSPATLEAHDSFELRNGVNLYGGFAGNEPMPVERGRRNFARNRTVLDGRGANDSVLRCSATGCSSALTVDGFTVTGGIGGATGGPTLNGGGLFNALGSLTLSNIAFVDNQADGQGGAIFNVAGNLTLSNVVLQRNAARREGAGIYSHSGKLAITNAVFAGNRSRTAGGGGLYTLGKTEVSNAVFLGNSAEYGAVVVAAHWFTLANSITWENSSVQGSHIFVNPGLATVAHSILQDAGTANNIAFAGISNSGGDPLFTNSEDPDGPDDVWGTADDGLILLPESPAIDAGTNEGISLPDRDLLGNPRISGSTVDTGPYEFDPSAVSTGYDRETEQAEGFVLAQNYPNPFNPTTQISITLPESGHVRLAVFDMLGHEVRLVLDRSMSPGTHEVTFGANDLPSGVYTYVMSSGAQLLQRKMVLSR